MEVYSKTRKSHYWNEDRFIVGTNHFIVIDGATPLKSTSGINEACWLVNYIKKNLSIYSGSVKNRLLQLCKDACNDIGIDVQNEEYLPSASVCWAEFEDSKVKIGILGDCEVTAICKDGNILRLYDDKLNVLDAKAIEEMVAIAKEKNICMKDAGKYIQETLIKHRKLANAPNGYSALCLSRNAEINEKNYELDIGNLKTLYLYSDGFSQAFGNLKIYSSHKEMFKQITSVDNEIKKIVKQSFSDANCDMYPRFKKIDDITVIKIDL